MADNDYAVPLNFIDLNAQQRLIRSEIDAAINRVLDHGKYIMGPEVHEFEDCLKQFTGVKHAITCANGTDALSLVLMAWGVGGGDAVFVPSFTYVASAEAPAQLGATPFFVDVSADTFNMDAASLRQAVHDARGAGLKPKAVVLVDLFGQPADSASVMDIASEFGLKVLVDGAQSFGGSRGGNKVGSMGHATTTSFFPAKPLGCYGDGGAIFTNLDEDAELISSIRLHGRGSEKYDNVRIGMNSRLDTIQAAVLLQKIKLFPDELKCRQKVADLYNQELSGLVKVPNLDSNTTSAWAQYTIQVSDREQIRRALTDVGVPTAVYYPIPLHEQLGYDRFPSVTSGLSTSSKLSREVLSLPMHPYMSTDTVVNIAKRLKQVLKLENVSSRRDDDLL